MKLTFEREELIQAYKAWLIADRNHDKIIMPELEAAALSIEECAVRSVMSLEYFINLNNERK